MRIVGCGRHLAPLVYGEDAADLALRAADSEMAQGQVFNVSCGEPVTWKAFLTTLSDDLGTRLPRLALPVSILYPAAASLEALWSLAGADHPPPATRAGVRLMATECRYDCARAADVLGFRARVFHREGLQKTLSWMRSEGLLTGLAGGVEAGRLM